MTKITRGLIESYIACWYKSYLMMEGHKPGTGRESEPPIQSNYEPPPTPFEQVTRLQNESRADGLIELTPSLLRRGIPEIIGSLYQTTSSSIQFDGLRKVHGSSDVGDFHYIPILFHPNGQVQEAQKSLLYVYGFILNKLQGRPPEHGILQRTKGKSSTVPISRNLKKGERLLNDLLEMQGTAAPPRLFLNPHCQACQFQNRCHAQAVEEDNLSLLRGISQTEIARLNKRGIFTINQLSYTFRPRRVKKRAKNPAHPHYFALQALAIREQKIFVHGSPNFESKETRIYLDIEGIPADQSYYLIGLLVSRDGVVDQKSFWGNTESDEVGIFMELLDHIHQYGECSIFHYGTYEVRALRSMQRRLPQTYSEMIDHILKQFVNVHSIIGPHIYFPVYSNSLKEIARYLGHTWSDSNASGIQAVHWRQRWKETQADSTREKLTRYNMEDCIGLKIVCDAVEGILREQPAPPHHSLTFVHTDHFEKEAGQRGKFQKPEFALAEFDLINRCSYFDYQRDRMSARSRRPPKTKPEKSGRAPSSHRNNKIVEVYASRCPVCRSKKLSPKRHLRRQIVDLKFSGAAVRRWVVLFLSQEYRCRKCNSKFIPAGFPTVRTKFGKGLVSWCMYQMFVGGQNMSRIRDGVAKLFGIEIDIPSIYGFKQSVALRYRGLYSRILETLIKSSVLYVDETTANLRSETGYVWCITDGRSAYYFYRSSREGSFLPDMFEGFKGVLVSDFYTAYDSVDCRQQRCLVHLMRDFNEEIHMNPFDSELKLLASSFSGVLRPVVETIDRYGFRTRHLVKHKRAVDAFYRWISEKEFNSSPAERLQTRIVKYQDRLFTFLDCNGVSWNNTYAEHFIKPFARYRRAANGIFTARSIQDFLVILSVSETCKGQGSDFLDFLLKDNKHVFGFRNGRSASRGDSSTEATLSSLLVP